MREGGWIMASGVALLLLSIALLFAMVTRFIQPHLGLSLLAYAGTIFGSIAAIHAVCLLGRQQDGSRRLRCFRHPL